MQRPAESEQLEFPDRIAWEAWLEENHARADQAWLRIAKRGSGATTVAIGEALDSALCFGWIDAIRFGLDDRYYLQRYTPRRARSAWSAVNVEKVAALEAAGRLRPAGRAQVELARADGRWAAAYPAQADWALPPEFAAALDAEPALRAAFDALGRTDRYQLVIPHLRARTEVGRRGAIERAIARLSAPGDPAADPGQ